MVFLEDKHSETICFCWEAKLKSFRPLGNILYIKSYEIQSNLVLQISAFDQPQQKTLLPQWQENKDISESTVHNMTANHKEESCQ